MSFFCNGSYINVLIFYAYVVFFFHCRAGVDVATGLSLLYQSLLPSWWRHQMETFSALLAGCVGNSPVTGEFPEQRPLTRSSYIFFDLRLNKHLSKQSWCWWFDTPSRSWWRHRKDESLWCGRYSTGPVPWRQPPFSIMECMCDSPMY